ncbi:MAG: alanine--tRNA ligase [Patescibacteria group bacterium]|jgi:alanyl-tRNA synthetase
MKQLTTDQVRQTFLDFFKQKGHAIIPSASLIPENDPTVLFTTAGMQPLVPYLLGQAHPMGKRLASVQKCLRTDDIDEVGDSSHGTFFEMLGNWSLGDYFKEETIGWSYELLTSKEWFGIDPLKLYVTVFEGDADAPRDDESISIWQSQFEVHGIAAELGIAGKDEPSLTNRGPRVYTYPKKKNWWGPAGQTGPCGPDTEMFYDTGKPHNPFMGPVCHPNCDCGRFVEIWNDVFMQYNKTEAGKFEPLAQTNVDTGMGLERMAAMLQGVDTIFDTDSYKTIINTFEKVFNVKYGSDVQIDRSIRILLDHIRAATFVIGDARGVSPSNVGQGYIVRRLIRRAVREAKRLGIQTLITPTIAQAVIEQYKTAYPELEKNAERILSEMQKEEEKFASTLNAGLKKMTELVEEKQKHQTAIRTSDRGPISESAIGLNVISGKEAFDLYQSYGFPPEMIDEELAKTGNTFAKDEFDLEFKKHQELSRTASAGVFKGGLADNSEQVTRLHTATHLLHQALRMVLGDHVAQKGSNITAERLRFDFVHPAKMTPEEIQQVEKIVNEVIQRDLPVAFEEMTVDEAKAAGAIGLFEDKYGSKVKVYTVADPTDPKGFFSKEICGGPHASRTGELGSFKIQKEEAVSAGVRRIKAVLGS